MPPAAAFARNTRALVVVLVIAFAALAAGASAGPDPTQADPASPTAAVPDRQPAAGRAESRLLVKFSPTATAAERAATVSRVGGVVADTIAGIGVSVVNMGDNPAQTALAALRASRGVEFAETDAVLKPQELLPNDPYFLSSGSWNLGGGAWGWYATHTTQAWDVTMGDPNVVIAVLDTGIKTDGLADFDGQIASTWNVLDGTTDATTNAGSHGTYVAGVAALALGNGVGNSGYCPKCRLMIVLVGTDSGASLSDIASGLAYAADHGARVANMSWAGASDSSTLQSAIDYAHDKGLVLTAAAGNSNCNCTSYPAADRNVLGVAGVSNAAGDKQGDSNYGSWVKIAAPEGNMTAWPTINGAPGYAAVGGTSVAAPAAAGIAGLLFSYDPSLTNTQVEQALEVSAAPVKFTVAHGRVDALAALRYLGASDPQPSSRPVQTSPPQLYYERNGWTSLAPLTSAPQVGQVLVRGVGGWTGSAGLSVSGLQWQRCDPTGTSCSYLSNQSTYTVQSADGGYAIKLAFSVGNPLGTVPASVLTPVVGATTTAPANTSPPTVSGTAQVGQTLTATTGSWSGSPASYAYRWLRCSSSGAGCTAISGATSSGYAVQTADVGYTLEVSVTASNDAGSATATSIPTAVVADAPSPTTSQGPTTQTQTFSGSLNPGNPTRTFSVTVGGGLADAQLAFSKCGSLSLGLSNGAAKSGPSVVDLAQTLPAGTYAYTVSGGKCSFTLTVTSQTP